MFYVAYVKGGGGPRPFTVFSTMGPRLGDFCLHMGAFCPRRIVPANQTHTHPPAVLPGHNGSSLLYAHHDLVLSTHRHRLQPASPA